VDKIPIETICAYCGQTFPVEHKGGVQGTTWTTDGLDEHIRKCPMHPLFKTKQENVELRQENAELRRIIHEAGFVVETTAVYVPKKREDDDA